jgi:hypothetical protein
MIRPEWEFRALLDETLDHLWQKKINLTLNRAGEYDRELAQMDRDLSILLGDWEEGSAQCPDSSRNMLE